MARYGLSYEDTKRINPALVYCSITGFGSGAGAALPGYDLLVQAVGGLMSVTGLGPDRPVKAGVALVDVLTGLHAVIGILAALRAPESTGLGQLIEMNLLSVLLSNLVNQAAGFTAAGAVPTIMGNRHPSIAPYQVFPALDQPIVIAVGNDRQFAALCGAIDAPELAADPRFTTNPKRIANVDALAELIGHQTRRRSAAEWFDLLTPLGFPSGPVNDVAKPLRSPPVSAWSRPSKLARETCRSSSLPTPSGCLSGALPASSTPPRSTHPQSSAAGSPPRTSRPRPVRHSINPDVCLPAKEPAKGQHATRG
jgi:crotonobetainyl-CoA:carnitine CoA-transferase CaiB-like acyl-CoA transferase